MMMHPLHLQNIVEFLIGRIKRSERFGCNFRNDFRLTLPQRFLLRNPVSGVELKIESLAYEVMNLPVGSAKIF